MKRRDFDVILQKLSESHVKRRLREVKERCAKEMQEFKEELAKDAEMFVHRRLKFATDLFTKEHQRLTDMHAEYVVKTQGMILLFEEQDEELRELQIA